VVALGVARIAAGGAGGRQVLLAGAGAVTGVGRVAEGIGRIAALLARWLEPVGRAGGVGPGAGLGEIAVARGGAADGAGGAERVRADSLAVAHVEGAGLVVGRAGGAGGGGGGGRGGGSAPAPAPPHPL